MHKRLKVPSLTQQMSEHPLQGTKKTEGTRASPCLVPDTPVHPQVKERAPVHWVHFRLSHWLPRANW